MKKLLQKSIIAVLFLSLLILLRFYFENSYLSIAVIVALGLMGGIASRIFVGYVIPNRNIFRFRFIIYGIGFGIMLWLLMFFTKSIKEQTFSFWDLLINFLIAIPLGIIFHGSVIYSRFRKLKKRTIKNTGKHIVINDFAFVTDSEYHTARGLLVLSDNKLFFYDNFKYERLIEMSLSEINPEITKSKLLKIPIGFSVKDEAYTVKVAFPLFWKKLIENEKKKQIASFI